MDQQTRVTTKDPSGKPEVQNRCTSYVTKIKVMPIKGIFYLILEVWCLVRHKLKPRHSFSNSGAKHVGLH